MKRSVILVAAMIGTVLMAGGCMGRVIGEGASVAIRVPPIRVCQR